MKKTRYGKKFCPNCGKIVEGNRIFCKDCTQPDFAFKDMKLIICNSCHSYFHKNKWTKFKDINTALKHIAKDNIKAKVTLSPLSSDILEYKAGIKKDMTLEVTHKGEAYDIPLRLEVTLCNKCSKKDTKYFESILQVRNAYPQIIDFIRNEVKKQHKKGVFINKENRIEKYSEKDIDFSITNQTYARILAQKIRKQFGGTIKNNAQLFSIDWETSKNIYRLHVYIEIPSYAKGDVIKTHNALYKITSISDKIHVTNIKNKSKSLLPHKNTYDILKPVQFQIIKKYPEYEVLDPNTYYQVRLMNPSENLEINQKIMVVVDAGEAWML
jgi:nonsense-mediated mRNA decay protein 3